MSDRALLAARLFAIVCFAAAAGFALATGRWTLAVPCAAIVALEAVLLVREW